MQTNLGTINPTNLKTAHAQIERQEDIHRKKLCSRGFDRV